jgi:hypothetical protein
MDSEGARKTTLTFIKEVSARLEESGGILWDRSKNPDRPLAIAPVNFLYEDEHGTLLAIPAKFTEDE